MKILLTNDDGIRAPGLAVLERIARQFTDDIWICAPDEEQSGMGHALTLTRPVRMRKHDDRRFSVTGTPTDAVTMGLRKVIDAPPDVILSGVNRGANLADDITYSGTVSAAIEGALAGVRSIALSQVYAREGMADDVPFDAAIEWGAKVLGPLLDSPLPARTLVNVNFPALPHRKSGESVPSGRGSTTIPEAQSSKGATRGASNITGSVSRRSNTRSTMAPTSRRSTKAISP